MMSDFFFGPLAVVGWFLAAAVFVFCASYCWIIVWEVGGVRGTALAITFTASAVICCCFGMIISDDPIIPRFWLGAIVSAAWPPIVVCALVLTDLYAADRNNHRSFTAKSYMWYKRITHHDGEENGGRHPITVNR